MNAWLYSICCCALCVAWSSCAGDKTPTEEDAPRIVWGTPTNSIRAGIWCSTTNKQVLFTLGSRSLTNKAYLVLGDSKGSKSAVYVFPAHQNCRLDLVDAQGRPVPRAAQTDSKRNLSVPTGVRVSRWKTAGFSKWIISAGDNCIWTELRLQDEFQIEKPGFYKLTYQQEVYLPDTNSILRAFELPPVSVEVDVSKQGG